MVQVKLRCVEDLKVRQSTTFPFLAEKEERGLILRMTESQTLYWLRDNRCHSCRLDSRCLSCQGSGFIIRLG